MRRHRVGDGPVPVRCVIGHRGPAAAALVGALAIASPGADQVFRAGVDLVTVDVSVLANGRPVEGLTARDFRVTDNGVPQTVDVVETTSVAIDVTIAIDTSGSMAGVIGPIQAQADRVRRTLRPDDRLRVLTFAGDVSQHQFAATDLQQASLEGLAASGSTSLYDALAVALMTPREGDRRHLVIAYTDGYDTISVIGHPTLREIARRSHSVLHLFLVEDFLGMGMPATPLPPRLNTRRLWIPPAERLFWDPLHLARDTGGRMDRVFATRDVPGTLQRTLEWFRAGYVLRYRATGVTPGGWHELGVAITRPGTFDVHARRGYYWR